MCCRLPQLGVYVDEAHHLFGADLEKELRSGGANKTTLRNTINMLAASTSIVACYNYTGKEIYFTGMFTSNQGDLSVQYYDPESKRLRKYYPDFLALMEDGSYQLMMNTEYLHIERRLQRILQHFRSLEWTLLLSILLRANTL